MGISSVLVLGILFFTLSLGAAEQPYSRSVVNMVELIGLNENLAHKLELYAEEITQKANTIRMVILQMAKQHQQWEENQSWDLLSSFSLIRHMQADWLMVQLYMEKPMEQEHLDLIDFKNSTFEDAVEGIRRMQLVYHMSARNMAEGFLNGVKYNSSLSAQDCLALALHLINQSRWKDAEPWILAGIDALNRPGLPKELDLLRGPNEAELYRILAEVRLELGQPRLALEAYQNALFYSPHDAEIFRKHQILESIEINIPSTDILGGHSSDEGSLLTHCCSGLCERSKNFRQYCFYDTASSPFLFLAPVKMEILSLEPFVMILHDVISLEERSLLRSASRKYVFAASLVDSIDKMTERLTDLLEDATGLDMEYSETFHVINYGLGGLNDQVGLYIYIYSLSHRRLSGSLFIYLYYLFIITQCPQLSDVPQGGATIFPRLNLTVFPKAGSALFWYNLDNQANADGRIDHVECPVIVGSKW
ncbi:hypothetical protein KR009_006460, partial [Drosophila setifemur]